MELKDVLTISISAILVLVIAHLAVFFVVKTMYPPNQVPAPVPVPVTQPVIYTQPVVEEQQNVVIPTYEAPISMETSSEKGPTRQGPPPAESTSIRGDSRVDTSNPQQQG